MHRYGKDFTIKNSVLPKSTNRPYYKVETALNEDLAGVPRRFVNTHSRLRPHGIMNSSDFERYKILKFS